MLLLLFLSFFYTYIHPTRTRFLRQQTLFTSNKETFRDPFSFNMVYIYKTNKRTNKRKQYQTLLYVTNDRNKYTSERERAGDMFKPSHWISTFSCTSPIAQRKPTNEQIKTVSALRTWSVPNLHGEKCSWDIWVRTQVIMLYYKRKQTNKEISVGHMMPLPLAPRIKQCRKSCLLFKHTEYVCEVINKQ